MYPWTHPVNLKKQYIIYLYLKYDIMFLHTWTILNKLIYIYIYTQPWIFFDNISDTINDPSIL